jgi:IS1 family transposase
MSQRNPIIVIGTRAMSPPKRTYTSKILILQSLLANQDLLLDSHAQELDHNRTPHRPYGWRGRFCVRKRGRVATERLELDEAWSFVGKKQKNVQRHEIHAKGDQYIFIGMAGTQKAIISWGVGKRNGESTMDFLHDLRSRVIGQPEISTDGFLPYRVAIRDAFGDSASHGVIVKTYSVTHLVKEAQGRYSPAAVVAVEHEVVTGDPEMYVSTSYVERQNLSLRMGSHRFTRLTNGFSKKLDNHVAAVALYVAHYNLCRVHEALRTTPAKAIGVADRAWTIGSL